MKKWIPVLLAVLVIFSGCLSTKSEQDTDRITLKGVTFHTNLTLALSEAKAQDKPLFVYARSENCGWCKKFEEETFTNQSVIGVLNENFILVSIDVYEQKNETLNFRVHGTPTEIFLDPNGIEIKRIPGYIDTVTFLNIIKDL